MLYALYLVLSLASLVCFIITLVKLFQVKGVLHGILGILCGLYTFIWGWINAGQHGRMGVMLVWTAALIGSLVMQFAFLPSMTTTP